MNRRIGKGAHLTNEQIAELLDGKAGPGAAEAHVAVCAECAAELETLQDSLALFRESATAFTGQQLAGGRRRPNMPLVSRRRQRAVSPPLVWAAAALVALAAVLPLRRNRQPAPVAITSASTAAAPARESDQALLEAIDRDLSASVPDSMQPLASPAAGSQTNLQTATIRKN